jgi:hypothetical protein
MRAARHIQVAQRLLQTMPRHLFKPEYTDSVKV